MKRHGREKQKQKQFSLARTKELGVEGVWLLVFQLHRMNFFLPYYLEM